jgi:hypothetical protein
LFTVSSVGSETGYKNINVTNVGSSGTSPFTNGQTVLLTFTRQGDKGDAGSTGAEGADGLDIAWRGAYDNGAMYAVNDAVSYQGSSYIAVASTVGNLPTNTSFWNLLAQKGNTGAQGPAGADGVVGAHGGAISIEYTFDDTTTDSDPGNGLLRLSNATQNSATVIRADHLDKNGTDWLSALTSLDDSTSTNKGQIRLFKADDQTKWLVFSVGAVGSQSGYKNITVSNVASSATNPFTNGDTIVLAYTRTGDKGETGSQGAQGPQGNPGEDGLDITWRGTYDNGTTYSINDAVSYQGSSYIAIASTVGNLPTNTSFWNLMSQKGDTGAAGSNGTNGTDGQHGGGVTTEYEFDSTTTDSDPGAGKLRLSNATQNASMVIRVDNLDYANTDWSSVLPTLDDSTSTIKGHVRLVHRTDPSKWLLFTVFAVGSETGYKNIMVSNVGSSTTSPFTTGDRLVVTFTRAGDKGDAGATGSTGATGAHGGAITIRYTFSTTTTDSDPGNGNLRLSSSTQNTSTAIRADLVDANGTTWTNVLDSLDESTSSVRGHIRLSHETDDSKWLLFTLSAVGSETGYRNITVTNVTSSASSPFSNTDPILLTFSRTGDQGAPGLTGNPGQDGQDGRHGGALTIEYTFSTTTTDSDPGNGNLRLNQATQNTSTVIRADLLDRNGTTWTSALDTFDDSTSAIKGYLRLVRADDQSKWLLFSVSSLASPSGYKNITVANVASSENNPFVNGDTVLLTFTRTGDKGDAGTTDNSVVDIYLNTGTHTWTKRAGATRVTGILVAGGGGGGSGRKGANSTDRNGGTGGAGGGATLFDLAAASVGSTETVTVGTGGIGGAAQTTNSTNGNAGGNGGTSSFGAHASATGGAGGTGGGTVNGTAPDNTSVGTGTFSGGAGGGGGNGNATSASTGGSPSGVFAGAGGGGGGGIASGNSVAAAGAGGSTGLFSGAAAGSTTPTAGASGFQNHNHQGYGGPGGGGGGSNSASTSNDRAGGNGGYYGAGGGGGGAGRNDTSNSGAGGNGGQGFAIVITYF